MSVDSLASPSTIDCLRAVADLSTDAMFIKDLAGRYVYCNAAGARFIGKPLAEIIARTDLGLFGPDNARVMQAQDCRVAALGMDETEEHVVYNSGEVTYFEVTKSPFRGADRKVIGVVGVARDVTKQKRAESALRRQQSILERLAQGASLSELLNELVLLIEEELPQFVGSILLLDPDGLLRVAAGPNLPHVYNQAIDGLAIGPQVGSCGTAAYLGEKVFVADIASDPLWKNYRDLALSHDLRACWSTPIVSRTSPERKVLGTFAIYSKQPGLPNARFDALMSRVEYLACIAIESRRASDALRQSEHRFRELADAIPQIVWTAGPDGALTHLNAKATEYTGVGVNQLKGWSWEEVLHPDDVPHTLERWMEILGTGIPWDLEFRIRTRDGKYRWHIARQVPVRDASGRIATWYGTCTDIEDLKQSTQSLEESEHKFRSVLDNHPAAVLIKDLSGRYLFANQYAADNTGVAQRDWIGKKASDFFPLEVASQFERNDREALELLQPRQIEEAILLPDGRNVSVLTAQFPLLRSDGQPYALCEISTDITSRKRSEEALQQSVSRLQATLEATADGILVVDLEGRIVDVNQQFLNIWGFPADLIPEGRKEDLLASFNNHAGMQGVLNKLKDPAAFIARVQQLYQTPEESSFEVLEFEDGRVVERFSQPQRIDGKPVGRVWSFRDITNRIQAERELRTTAGLLQAVADGTSDAIFVKDLQGRYLFFNQAAARFVGKSIPEVIGQDDTALFEQESARLLMERDRRVIACGVVETQEETVAAAGVTRTYQATKGPYRNAAGETIGLVGISRDISDMKRDEARLHGILTSVTDSIITVNSKAQIVSVNPATEKLFGYAPSELIGLGLDMLMPPPHNVHAAEYFRNYFRTSEKKVIGKTRELPQRRKDGSVFSGELTVSEVQLNGEPHFVGVVRDITERKRLEEHLRQAQKLEAIGRLAGGIAHDFNNLLTVINGYAELLLASGESNRDQISAIRSAGDRAAALTAQLLAFSRKAIIEPKVLDLNETVESTSRMLSRLIGEDIRLVIEMAPNLAKVCMDPSQLEQILMNLALNARDAMPRGGVLRLATANVHMLFGLPVEQGNSPPGDYVELLVIDNGEGMSEAVRGRIFEPFFTTKELGKGTGLGLATVYGIVSQAGGAVSVESQEGHGTTFRILLPAVAASEKTAKAASTGLGPRGSETVLLAEDETRVRQLIRLTLEKQGYTVLEAKSGEEAIRISTTHVGPIHLLITDVVMPGLNGCELAESLRAARPDMAICYVSGYMDDAIIRHGFQASLSNLLQKPFSPSALVCKVREVLDHFQKS